MPPNPNAPFVLLTFANPTIGDYPELRNLPDEARTLRQLFDGATQDGHCQLLPLLENAVLDDIFDMFKDSRYHKRIAIYHFAGHSDSYHLLLQTANRQPLLANAQGFAEFLAVQSGLQLVFLNGCSSEAQVKALHEAGVKAVIATTEDVPDDWALPFAASFYKGLVTGMSILAAYRTAVAEMRTIYGTETDWPWRLFTQADSAAWQLSTTEKQTDSTTASTARPSAMLAAIYARRNERKRQALQTQLDDLDRMWTAAETERRITLDPVNRVRLDLRLTQLDEETSKVAAELQALLTESPITAGG